MQMQVEDDTSPSRKGRKANIRVVSRGAQQQASAALTKLKSDPQRKKPQKTGLAKGHVSTNVTGPICFLESLLNLESAKSDSLLPGSLAFIIVIIRQIIRLIAILLHFIPLA